MSNTNLSQVAASMFAAVAATAMLVAASVGPNFLLA